MTKGQEWIRLYIAKRFKLDSVRLQNIDSGIVQLTDESGATMRFTVNAYGDIMDADSGEIIANSNISHDLDELTLHPMQEPTDWTDNPKYFEGA